MWKGYHVSIEGVRKGYFFSWKMAYKWVLKGLYIGAEPPCIKCCWATPPPPQAGMLFVPVQELSVIEWIYSLISDTLRYDFPCENPNTDHLFIYDFVCRDGGPGDFTIRYQDHCQWFREWIHLRTENEGTRKKEAYYFVLFYSVSFNLFYVFFFHIKIAQTSHVRYKRPTDTMIQHTLKK